MNAFDMVVLDMAGTTVDEQNVVYKTLHRCVTEAGIAVGLSEVLAIGAGQEKLQAIKDVIASTEPDKADVATEVFARFQRELDRAYADLGVKPISGVEEVLAWLKASGVSVVLNTGYSRSVATGLLTKLGWQHGSHFDELVTASDVSRGRPHPDMIELAARKLGHSDPKRFVKVGDSIIDIKEGQNAGCGLTIGVLSGAQTRDQLATAHPDYILPSLASVLTNEELKARFG